MRTFFTLIFFNLLLNSYAQQPILIKDIAPGTQSSTILSQHPFTLDSFYFFTSGDLSSAQQYWVTDGTADGTKLLKQIAPPNPQVGQLPLFNYNHVAYFYSDDDEMGNSSLWRTDGTTDGTNKFMEYCGTKCRVVGNNAVLNDKLIFTGTDEHGDELWLTDGTETNTILLKDINPGSVSGGPNGFYTFKGKVYFTASSNGMNRELWMTDGTSTGTEIFIDLDNSDLTESAPQILGIMGDFMYFSAKGPATGRELWKTDGTIQGTTIVKDVNPGADNGIFSTPNVSIPYYFKVINDKFLFIANEPVNGREWWVSNGLPEGTHILKDIVSGPSGMPSSLMLFSTDSFALFQVDDSIHGRELWRTDGTEAGTFLLKDIYEGPEPGMSPIIDPLYFQDGNKLYFIATDSAHYSQIWVTDGTLIGTKRLTDMYYHNGSSIKNNLSKIGNYLYFTAATDEYGYEIWKLSVEETSGTQDAVHPENISFTVYPNPNRGQFQITGTAAVPADVNVTLYDMQGKLVASQKFSQLSGVFMREMRVPNVPGGLYVLNLQTESGNQTKLISIVNN